MAALPRVDLRERVCVVTGASSGIGKEIARNLARLGGTVVLACRAGQKAERARAEITADTRNSRVSLVAVDLSNQQSIREFASRLLAMHGSIAVLVNNASVWMPIREYTVDGIEATWAVNVLAYHLVTRLLVGALHLGRGRIVNVTSEYAGGLDLRDVEFRVRRYSGVSAYRQSKQAERMLTWAQARALAGTRVTANAVHPGGVNTGIYRRAGGLPGWLLRSWVRWTKVPPAEGADTPTWAAASDDAADRSGEFWVARRQRQCAFRDPEAVNVLWRLCEEMTSCAKHPQSMF